jgi:hypothetical protein
MNWKIWKNVVVANLGRLSVDICSQRVCKSVKHTNYDIGNFGQNLEHM